MQDQRPPGTHGKGPQDRKTRCKGPQDRKITGGGPGGPPWQMMLTPIQLAVLLLKGSTLHVHRT